VHPIKGWTNVETVIRRIAKKADGWLPTFDPDDTGAELVERFRGYCREYGRDPTSIGIEALLIPWAEKDWAEHVRAWQRLGATQMCCNCSVQGVQGVDGNLKKLEEIQRAMKDAGLWSE
jgi:alkanesulfonate monooxygenase SsuD/methylene tetrahydromethanopterin reductase-like flavin-dependent oxidoreductase (luciferase family)